MNFHKRTASVLVGLTLSSMVMAHAMLDRSAPRVGSSVKGSPSRVELWFSEPLEPAFSSVKVVDAGGRQVDGHDATVDARDPRHFSISISALPPGRYRVVWRAVSVDTHATKGDFTFDIVP